MMGLGLVTKTCKTCNGATERIIELLGTNMKVRVMCECESKKYESRKKEEAKKDKILRLERLRNHSLMSKQFEKCTFENFIVDPSNQRYFNIAKRYADRFKEIEKENIGLLLYGPVGTGKTYLAFCIANQLINNMTPTIAISSIGLLNKIKETYGKWGSEGEVQIINSLKNASLLILDDLGAENNTSWAKEKLYEIIDSRYRDGKPIIITTNLSLDKLRDHLSSDGVYRTYDRLIEMCTPLEIKGKARRIEKAKEKQKILRDLMGD